MNRHKMKPSSYIVLGFALESPAIGNGQKNWFDGGETLTNLLSMWYCSLSAQYHDARLGEDLVFGVVNTSKWRRGIIVLVSQIPEETIDAYFQKNRSHRFRP